MDILYRRLETINSVREKVANMWDSKFNGSPEETTVEVISEVWGHTKGNKPIS